MAREARERMSREGFERGSWSRNGRDASVKFNQAVPLVIMDERQALKCKLESGSRTA